MCHFHKLSQKLFNGTTASEEFNKKIYLKKKKKFREGKRKYVCDGRLLFQADSYRKFKGLN